MGLTHATLADGAIKLKPSGNAPGSPFDFDVIPIWICPGLWDETKEIHLRGFLFVVLYTLSVVVFFAICMVVIVLLFSRPIGLVLWFSQFIALPLGVIYGLATWWDFTRRKKLLLENAAKKTDVPSQDKTS